MAEPPPRAFVCGHPIAHSRSPLIHGHWLERYRIAGTYERIDVAPDDFAGFLESLREAGFAGGNVTLPHKEAAFAAVARRDEAAEAIGAVNTLWFEDGRLCGSNTDAYGFAAGMDAGAPAWRQGRSAVVLGAGGASRAVLHALLAAGYRDVRIINRTRSRIDALQRRFGPALSAHSWEGASEALEGADLVVNTSSLGMAGGEGGEGVALDLSPLPSTAIVSDIVYVPLETPLLAAAGARGLATVGGLAMLLHQAVPGFERWFGLRPEVTGRLHDLVAADVMRAHGEKGAGEKVR